MRKVISIFLLGTIALAIIVSCGESKPEIDKIALQAKANGIFMKLPASMPGAETDTPEKIALGKKLYFEEKLSKTNTQSCNTCHSIDPGKAGVDNKPTSPGAKTGTIGTRNSPTVLNAGFQFVQFWDGRAKDLKEQALGPILNPLEMGMDNPKEVEDKLTAMPEYVEMFAKAFPSNPKISWDNLGEAVAAFERTLITKDRFDFFLGGNPNALTDEEAQGLEIFMNKGCTTCHTGPLLGGNMYQKMGLYKPYSDTKDMGRFDITKNEAEKFMFKVPTLRNIALTAPYFHDGASATLEDAVTQMSNMQLVNPLTPEEVKKVVTFFGALTDIELAKANKK
ncbi:MAG: cytochrome-c peroxidase [Ignavibacteriae bacterium]|nr:cytochrome-c peroxidase [Ignavibacteriota bacterium]